jgi:hypothetical protein
MFRPAAIAFAIVQESRTPRAGERFSYSNDYPPVERYAWRATIKVRPFIHTHIAY